MVHSTIREKLLGKWGRWGATHWIKTLLFGAIISVFMSWGVIHLTMEMTFFSIMPGQSTQVKDLKQIMGDYPLASGITIVIDGRTLKNQDVARKKIEATILEVEQEFNQQRYKPYIKAVYGHINRDFFKSHSLIINELEDRERLFRIFKSVDLASFLYGLNNDFEREYSGNDQKLKDDESEAVGQFEGLNSLINLMVQSFDGQLNSRDSISQSFDDFLFGPSYYLSKDNRMAIIQIEPTFTMEDFSILVPGVNTIEEGAKLIAARNGLKAYCTGLTTIARDEMITSQQGLGISMLLAFFLILLIMVFVFKMCSTPLITGVPLLIGIYWSIGMTGFLIHRLNIMTAMYMVALVGLGIDYSIHLLTSYTQERDNGLDYLSAMEKAFATTGSGILTGALTTAIAFFSMMVADTELMRELGMVAGLGILFELLAMLIFLPPLIGLASTLKRKKPSKTYKFFTKFFIPSDFGEYLGSRIVKHPTFFIILMLSFSAFLAIKIGDVKIEKNLLNMEAKDLESVKMQDVLVDEFGMGADGLFVLTQNIHELKDLEKQIKKLDSVKQVESLAPLLLTEEEWQNRIPGVVQFKQNAMNLEVTRNVNLSLLKDELIRLEMNLIELSDMSYLGNMKKMSLTLNQMTGYNKEGIKERESALARIIDQLNKSDFDESMLRQFQYTFSSLLKEKLINMSSIEAYDQNELPPLYGKGYYSQKNNSYLMSIIPTQNPWEGDFRQIFLTQVSSITDKGTGMIMASDQLTIMAESDGLKASMTALIAIFLILLIDFRNLKIVIFTMIPLCLSFIALFGFMGWTGMRFDFVNIIAVPLLIGIGIDDSVHISHRYLLEGKGQIERVIAKTGTAVMLTSLTTIIAFASFIPSVMQAMHSTGILLSVAMTFAFLFSIIFYPAFLNLVVDRNKFNLYPWGS
ncbi:efflux RND transporter permease subunit [Spirochaeta cellobiosiphila]|uniref:efflux RND transporter permease subunit n=1 Tax=Spirochaeta cellobiosiphila TaxID=504483 RepID=UPI000404369C|nr:MMPL family transporter [Spirochaeta cellobiosiphila]